MSLYSLTQAQESVRGYTRRFERRREIIQALLGDGAGNVEVSGDPGWVWVRVEGDPDGVAEAKNRAGSLPLVEGIVVDLQRVWPTGLGYYEVLGLSSTVLYETTTVGPGSGDDGSGRAAVIAAHAAQHVTGDRGASGFDPLTVNVRALAPLRARAQTTPNMTVVVDGGYYFINSFKLWTAANSGAFTAPAALASTKYDLLYLGSDDALHIVAGTPVVGATPTFPAIPANSIPICFVYLTATTTSITEAEITDARVVLTASVPALTPTTGVTSIAKSGEAALVGDVTLSEGANIALTQVGQDIQIAVTGVTATLLGILGWYDAKVDGGLVGDNATDDTAALQALIDTATASGTRSATIYFPPGRYLIAGALQDTGVGGFNGQILLPNVSTSDPQITIRFIGAARPPFALHGSLPGPGGYTFIRSSLTGATGTAACISGGNGTFPVQNNVSVHLENLIFLSPDNPTFTMVNLSTCQGGRIDNILITVVPWTTCSQPTNSNAYGLKLPQWGNSNYTYVDGLMVGGHYTGLLQGELAICRGLMFGLNIVAVELPTSEHASMIIDLQQTACTYGIKVTGTHYCDVLQYDAEHYTSPAWAITVYDLDDGGDDLYGHIRWMGVAVGGAVDHVFNVNGGANCFYEEIGKLMPDSGVTPGTYGDATNVPQITIDEYGRITAETDVPIAAGLPDPGSNGIVTRTAPATTGVAVASDVTGLFSGAGDYLKADGTTGTPAGAGDVVGPAGATDGDVALFDTATGKLLKDGGATDIAALFSGAGDYLKSDGTKGTPAGTGDVVGPGGATDGNLAVFDGATGKLLKDGGAPGGGGAPTTSEYVTTAADAGLSAEVVIPGLAGSPDIAGSGGAGFSEEFDSSSVILTWDAAPSVVDYDTTVKSHIYVKLTGNGIGRRAWTPGAGAFDIRAKVSLGLDTGGSSPIPYFGLFLDNAGKTDGVLLHLIYVTPYVWHVYCFTEASSSFTQRADNGTITLGNTVYWRIVRDGSNNFDFYISNDGLTWFPLLRYNFSVTLAYAGFRIGFNSGSGTAYLVSDWLRSSV